MSTMAGRGFSRGAWPTYVYPKGWLIFHRMGEDGYICTEGYIDPFNRWQCTEWSDGTVTVE